MSDQSQLSSRSVMGVYFARVEAAPERAWVSQLAELYVGSQTMSGVWEQYPFIGHAPPMRPFGAGRQVKGLHQLGSVTIESKPYEATLEVNVRDWRNDKTGQMRLRVEEFADQSVQHWISLIYALTAIGETATAYDGQTFFSTTHSEFDSGVQSNSISVDISEEPTLIHGIPTQPSLEEFQRCIARGVTQFFTLKDDQGEPINGNARRFVLMVPVKFLLLAQAAVAAFGTQAAQQNVNPVAALDIELEVVANPRLTWTDRFALYRVDGSTKPIIRQTERDFQVRALAEGSEFEFNNDAWQFGIDAIRNVAFGHWQRAVLVRMV